MSIVLYCIVKVHQKRNLLQEMILKKMQQFDQVRTTEEIATSTTKYKEFTPIVCS